MGHGSSVHHFQFLSQWSLENKLATSLFPKVKDVEIQEKYHEWTIVPTDLFPQIKFVQNRIKRRIYFLFPAEMKGLNLVPAIYLSLNFSKNFCFDESDWEKFLEDGMLLVTFTYCYYYLNTFTWFNNQNYDIPDSCK